MQCSASAACRSLLFISRPLRKKSSKSSSLLGYFDCCQSNHTMGWCNINFSGLCQIKWENCFASSVSILLLYYFAWLQLFHCHVFQLFTLRPLIFCFSTTLYFHSLLKIEYSWVIFEKETEKEKLSGKRGFQTLRQTDIFGSVLRSKSNLFLQFPLGIVNKHAKKNKVYRWLKNLEAGERNMRFWTLILMFIFPQSAKL